MENRFLKNCTINTPKQKRFDLLRMKMEDRLRLEAPSSPDNQHSEATLPQDIEKIQLHKVYDDLKSKSQAYRDLVSFMPFATESGSEVKKVLSEYGNQLLSDRKMRESAPIMLELLEKGHFKPVELPEQLLEKVESLQSQLQNNDLAQAHATYQEISKQIKELLTQKQLTDAQKKTIEQWINFNGEVQEKLKQHTTANQIGEANVNNSEKASLYLEHVLAEAQSKTLTEVTNRLHDLHESLVERFDEHMRILQSQMSRFLTLSRELLTK